MKGCRSWHGSDVWRERGDVARSQSVYRRRRPQRGCGDVAGRLRRPEPHGRHSQQRFEVVRARSGRARLGLAHGVALLVGMVACAPRHETLTVFAAASLGAALDAVARDFQQTHPSVEVRVELGASRAACLKVIDGRRSADVLVSADAELIDALLMPQHATFNLLLGRTGLVLAYSPRSPLASRLQNGTPWQIALSERPWHVGVAHPDYAPVGYRALMALQLNDMTAPVALRQGGSIAAHLREADRRPDAAKLLAPLQLGELDAAFVYRSDAMQHAVPWVPLDSHINFEDPDLAAVYARASYTLPHGQLVRGAPIMFSVTVLRDAAAPALAQAFVLNLLAPAGLARLRQHHVDALSPAQPQVRGQWPPWLILGGGA